MSKIMAQLTGTIERATNGKREISLEGLRKALMVPAKLGQRITNFK